MRLSSTLYFLRQRRERRVDKFQIAIVVFTGLDLPSAIAVAAGQSLEVHDDRVRPRVLQTDELKVLHVVAVAVEGKDQRELARAAAMTAQR